MKRIFVLSFIAAGFYLNAQSLGNSPYAAFGIGDVKYDNTVDINAMGGISTAYINDFTNSFNFKNPAANTNLEVTSLKVEATNENNFFKSDYNNSNVTKHSTYLSNISIAFPLSKKMKFGLGYQPYSSKSYDILTKDAGPGTFTTANRFHGEGGLNTVQAALSYNFSPSFAFGFRSNFYFGNVYDINEVTLLNPDQTAYSELINGYQTKKKIKTFNFTLGTTYQKKFQNDRKFTLGATGTFGNTGEMTNSYLNSTYFVSAGNVKNQETVIDQIQSKDKNVIPTEISVGVGYGRDAKWFAGTQVDYKKGESINFMGSTFDYQNSYRVSVGGWYLPNFNNFRNYFSRVTYRYGAYYEKGNLSINGTDINKFALTGGVTLPFVVATSRLSALDVGVEIGKRGTTQNNLVLQNFVNLKIGLNFADKWFNKRFYD